MLLAGVEDKVPGRSDVPGLRCYLQVLRTKSQEDQMCQVWDVTCRCWGQSPRKIRCAKFEMLLAGVEDKVPGRSDVPSLKCYLQVFKIKSREGQVERVTDAYTVIGKNLFKKETNIQAFTNLKVTLTTGHRGIIEGGFGQSGKVKVRIPGKGIIYIYVQKKRWMECNYAAHAILQTGTVIQSGRD